MKDLDQMNYRDLVKSRIWNLFDIIRDDINFERYDVVLLFLHLRKVGHLSVLNLSSPKEGLLLILKGDEEAYQQVYSVFLPALERLKEDTIIKMRDTLLEIDSEWFNLNYSFLFNHFEVVISKAGSFQGKSDGLVVQPKDLTDVMTKFIGPAENLNVFNPFAGTGSLLTSIENAKSLIGQEINLETWAIGQLRLMSENSNAELTRQDSILDWPEGKFDLIVSNPPFSMKLNGDRRKLYPDVRSGDEFLIKKSVQSLSSSGRLVSVLPHGILFRGGSEQRLREHLINEDLIDTIISFPGGILYNTSIPFIILVLNKAKENPGEIRLIQANDCVSSVTHKEYKIEADKLFQVSQGTANNKFVRIVSNDDVVANDFNLNIPRYFKKDIEGVKLRELLTYFKGDRSDLPENGKLIRIRDLKNDKLDFKLDLDRIEDSPLKRSGVYKIDASCLLLAIRWKTLKPTYFRYENEPIYNGSDILPFKVDETKVDVAYLINELHADYVHQQLDALRQGVSIPTLRRNDLLDVKIKLPSLDGQQSLEIQRAKVEGVNQTYIKAKESEINQKREILGLKQEAFNEFASMKHTFRQYLGALKSNLIGTRKFIAKKDGTAISLDDLYSKKLNQTLGEHLVSMEKTIVGLSKLLEPDTSKVKDVQLYKLELLIERAHQRFQNDIFDFELFIDSSSFGEDELNERLVEIDEDDFMNLFSNIVSNAIHHGFKGTGGNIIRTELSYNSDEDFCVMQISNNGSPMPEELTLERLTTRGEKTTDSTGTGIGGADIKNIVSSYHGKLELIKDMEAVFPVTYKISLPTNHKDK